MDFDLTDVEESVRSLAAGLARRYGGPARAKELAAAASADTDLAARLKEAGLLDLFDQLDAGPPAAGLVVEEVARGAGVLPIGARALVLPAVTGNRQLPDVVAVVAEGSTAPVRFGAQAGALLVIGSDEARLLRAGEWTASPEPSKYGSPIARVAPRASGEALGPGTARVARRWWQAAVASEVAGTARAALELTTQYVKEREQFGRSIGSYQAVQHRLAECAVQAEGVCWLAREAIGSDADPSRAASAAVAAATAAQLIMQETHQLTGAMGFTLEYDLHVWSLRLQALRVEAGGPAEHTEALVAARWG